MAYEVLVLDVDGTLMRTDKTISQKTIDEINYYIDEFNPLDKAGSYGIQELPDGYLDKYEGSFENIVGLAPESVEAVLDRIK